MAWSKRWRRRRAGGGSAPLFGLEACEPRCLLSTFTVTNANDTGAGSLRQAILDANSNSGTDTIQFNIPGTGPFTIKPATPLPRVSGTVTIDGYTQPGASANALAVGNNAVLKIELSGELMPTSPTAPTGSGIYLDASNCTVRGLVINRFATDAAIEVGASRTNTVIEGNFLGTNVAGTGLFSKQQAYGVIIRGTGARIGGTTPAARNLISGNSVGILLAGTATVQGNYIGTNAAGTAAVANGTGIYAQSQAAGVTIGAAGAGNVISGNTGSGLRILGANNITLLDNSFGAGADGTTALGNATGVRVEGATGINIGDATTGNTIANNSSNGLMLENATVTLNSIRGLDRLRVGPNSTATVGVNVSALVVDDLLLDITAKLDLKNKALVVKFGPDSYPGLYNDIRTWVASARNATPAWSGYGITSADAALPEGARHGLISTPNHRSVAPSSPMIPSYGGVSLDADDLIIAYAIDGDLDLNGYIDGDDYFEMDQAFLSGETGQSADLNYDGPTDGEDLLMIDGSFLSGYARPLALSADPIEPQDVGIDLF